MNNAEMKKQLDTLKAENEKLKKIAAIRQNPRLTFKVTEKGGISVYGHGQRFPTTLYAASWEKILDNVEDLRSFIKENETSLSRK